MCTQTIDLTLTENHNESSANKSSLKYINYTQNQISIHFKSSYMLIVTKSMIKNDTDYLKEENIITLKL